MTSVLSAGKYRSRKDWSTSSIPTLVSLEEESTTPTEEKPDNGIPPKPPRRSSLVVGLLGRNPVPSNNNTEKPSTKRRSSIAVAFLGRRDGGQKNKDQFGEMPSIGRLKDGSADGGENGVTNAENGNYLQAELPGRRHRRSSWQAKFERRRRKVGLPPTLDDNEVAAEDELPIGYARREKRHSWWNILKPENLKQRSRRSSQADVDILSRTGGPVFRSKSRSVDHGLAPFDLDSLKSKVEGRIDSVERLSRDAERKKAPPIPTTTYTVGDRDTLTSVAARFDTTPSELSKLNRLVSSFIYPGQQLLVPDKSAIAESAGEGSTASGKSSPTGKSTDDLHEEKELLDGLRPGSPKPGHIERVSSPNVQGQHNEDDPVITQRFLKINVRHITDGQGVVGGVLLVTPNAVMFDPNVSDPLVIEHGPESYGVIAPMDLVVNAAIFHDIAHMRVGNEQSNDKPEVYYPKPQISRYESTHSPGKDSLLVKDETFPELGVGSVEGCDDQESVCSSNGREGDAFPKAFERDLVTPTNLQHAATLAEFRETTRDCLDKAGTAAAAEAKETKSDEQKGETSDEKTLDMMTSEMKTLEERRKSLLDQHWAIPSKDRNCHSISQRSQEDEEDVAEESLETVASMPQAPPVISQPDDEDQQLVKLSCHDSGIDIRDPISLPLPPVQQIPTKKVYSDADIVLSSDWVPPLTIAATHFSDSPPKSAQMTLSAQSTATAGNLDQGGRKKTSSVSFSVEDSEHQATDKMGGDKKNKMLKRLSYPLAWVEGLTGEGNKSESIESAPNTGDSNQSVFSKVFSRRSSIGTFIRPSPSSSESSSHPSSHKSSKAPPPKLDYRSMVSIDDMPELFVSFDMRAPLFPQLEQLELIPRPARACPDPPLYLRLRMGRPMGKSVPLPTSVMSYGKNKLRPEYWFSIPKNRVDELFRFLNSWVPHLYGELNEEKVAERGYELIQHDTEWAQGGVSKEGRVNSDGEDIAELTRESWEVLSMSADDYRKSALFPGGSFDLDFPIPDLVGQTEILTEEHREKLCGHLPARAEGYSWSLVFSTSQHGFSLNSLYRKMHRLESPILIVIQDTGNNVFGALTSCSLHVSDHFYGTGESLLYKFNPSFKVFHWTGENLYFIKGNPESLSIGAGDGIFGLWLDGDLNQGRSQHCSTYGNEPLAPQEDFVVKTLECWAFV
ncbi:nuclear receptor coactivator 7 isoform X6 [Lutzomyia longipalpis]|uniref:nuclear receptor coactivator 7 isoform X6 n=1 Tax=Lutzomyia longipalpis TaxID=7200 RepID=UPI0024834684|nr:nuclear receptor coactivator 7 isoform X6 [Lutzomyia longipalpis]